MPVPIKCALCKGCLFNRMAKPGCCEHMYHVECLIEWTSRCKNDYFYENCVCKCTDCRKAYETLSILESADDKKPKTLHLRDLLCSICYTYMAKKMVVQTDPCGHYFCGLCVYFMHNRDSSCPRDESEISRVHICSSVCGRKIFSGKFKDVLQKYMELQRGNTIRLCERCRCPVAVNREITCQSCFMTFHKECLPKKVSEGCSQWYCLKCTKIGKDHYDWRNP